MSTPVLKQDISPSLNAGWYVLACTVIVTILAADYQGPIIAIAIAIVVTGSGILWIRNFPIPRFPAAGYWLVGILVLGLGSAMAANIAGYRVADINLQRDIGISVSYILFLTVGYYFAYNRSSLRVIFVAVAAAGLVISIVHLVKFGIVVSTDVTDLYLTRLDAGRGSHSQYAALCACLILLKDAQLVKYRFLIYLSTTIIVISILSSLSRGLMLDLIILAIAVIGLTTNPSGMLIPDPSRFLVAVLSSAAGLFGIYYALRFLVPGAYQFVNEFFVTKLMNSFTEVSGTNLETREQIASNYRAFELAYMMQRFDEQPPYAQWLGQGWGTSVKFGMETASTKSDFSRTEAAFLHNGYAYYLMKVGIIGVFLYVGYLCHLAFRATSSRTWATAEFSDIRRNILLATVVVLAVNTVTSGGLGFPASYLGLVVLMGACYGPIWGPDGDERARDTAPMSTVSTPGGVCRRIGANQ